MRGAEKNLSTVTSQEKQVRQFIAANKDKKLTNRETTRLLEHLSAVLITADVTVFLIYMVVIFSLILASIYYPTDGRSLVVFCFSAINLCVCKLIKQLKRDQILGDPICIRCCQQVRCWIFSFFIFISAFAQFGDIDLTLSLVFWIISGIMVLFDIGIRATEFRTLLHLQKDILIRCDSVKQHKFSD